MARMHGLAAVTAAVVFATGCGGSHSKAGGARPVDHPVVLRLAMLYPDQIGSYLRETDELSHHSITFREADPGPMSLHGDARLVADVRSGRLAMAAVPVRVFDRLGVRAFQALDAPLLIDSYTLEGKVLSSPVVKPMLASTRRLGVVGVAILPGPLRRVLGLTRTVTGPENLRDAVVGYQDSALSSDAIEALGGTPRALSPEARRPGVDAYEQQLGAIFGNEYLRGSSTRTIMVDPPLWPRPQVLIVNPRVYARLSPHQRAVLTAAGARSAVAYARALQADDVKVAQQLCTGGGRLITGNAAQFRAAFAGVYAQLRRDPQTAKAIAQIEALKRDVTREPQPRCGASKAEAARRQTPLDGVWRTTRPRTSIDTTPENYGTIIRVFDRGRYALQQWSAKACTWTYGRYKLDGRRIISVVTDAGGIAPSGAGGKPGETVPLLWNIYRGKLSMPNAPELHDMPVEATPYTLVTKTPSSRYFIKRCPVPADWDR